MTHEEMRAPTQPPAARDDASPLAPHLRAAIAEHVQAASDEQLRAFVGNFTDARVETWLREALTGEAIAIIEASVVDGVNTPEVAIGIARELAS